MKPRFFDAEKAEVSAHIETLDALIALLHQRIAYLEGLKTRAVRLQGSMQEFCDMLDQNEAALQAQDMDDAGTYRAPPTPN